MYSYLKWWFVHFRCFTWTLSYVANVDCYIVTLVHTCLVNVHWWAYSIAQQQGCAMQAYNPGLVTRKFCSLSVWKSSHSLLSWTWRWEDWFSLVPRPRLATWALARGEGWAEGLVRLGPLQALWDAWEREHLLTTWVEVRDSGGNGAA